MKTKTFAVALAAALVVPSFSFAKEREEEINSSSVPAPVLKTAEDEAKYGGRIVRWEKEGKRYEAVIDKGGKQWGVVIDEKGKVLNKHDESKEKGEKHAR